MTSSEYATLTLAEMQTRSWVTTERVRSGQVTIPRGTRVKIIAKRAGLTIKTPLCDRCGIEASVSRVQPWKIEEVL